MVSLGDHQAQGFKPARRRVAMISLRWVHFDWSHGHVNRTVSFGTWHQWLRHGNGLIGPGWTISSWRLACLRTCWKHLPMVFFSPHSDVPVSSCLAYDEWDAESNTTERTRTHTHTILETFHIRWMKIRGHPQSEYFANRDWAEKQEEVGWPWTVMCALCSSD